MSKTKEKSNPVTYSNEIWDCIRAVYEADGGSSINRMLEVVQNATQANDLPSRQTVVARAKREKWQRPDSLQQLSTSQLQKVIQRANGMELILRGVTGVDEDTEIENNQEFSSYERLDNYNADTAYLELKNNLTNAALNGVKKLLSAATHTKKKKAQIINRARTSQDRLYLLREHTLDQIIISKELLTNIQYKLLAKEEDISNTELTMNFNLRFLELLNNTIQCNEKFIKTDFAIYGISPDDVKEPETQNRMKDLNDENDFIEAKSRLEEQVKEMAARRQYIESGQLEKDVEEHVRRQMIEAGMDDSDDDDDNYDDE